MQNWYVINTKPKKEFQVERLFTEGGFKYYNPVYKQDERVLPFFPGYGFLAFDFPDQYQMVKFTRGVKRVVGNKDLGDALRLGGFLVSPEEIEDVLQAHSSVAAAQVVGVDTPAGTKAFAFVIVKPGAHCDAAALIDHCAARLAKFKVPVRVAPIDAFPVTPGANATKIQKSKLRELAQASLARRDE